MDLTMLSIALYVIDLVENLKVVLVFVIIVALILTAVGNIFYWTNKCEEPHKRSEEGMSFGKWCALIAFPCLILSTGVHLTLPEKDTMRMIVAIESANAVAQTDEAKEMLSLVQQKIKNSLEN